MSDLPQTPLSQISHVLTGFFPWLWVSLLSIAGGVASYFRKMKIGSIKRFSVAEFVGEVFIAFFVGIVTMLFCQWGEVNIYLAGGLVGLSAHMGSRALFVGESIISRKVFKWFGVPVILDENQGPQGIQGEQGVQGEMGPQGTPGKPGVVHITTEH